MSAPILVAAVTKTAVAKTTTTTSTTAVVNGSVPTPTSVAPPGSAGFLTILGWVSWGALVVCVMGVIVVGARMALAHRRGDGGEHVQGLGMVLVGCVIVGAASGIVGALV